MLINLGGSFFLVAREETYAYTKKVVNTEVNFYY